MAFPHERRHVGISMNDAGWFWDSVCRRNEDVTCDVIYLLVPAIIDGLPCLQDLSFSVRLQSVGIRCAQSGYGSWARTLDPIVRRKGRYLRVRSKASAGGQAVNRESSVGEIRIDFWIRHRTIRRNLFLGSSFIQISFLYRHPSKRACTATNY